MANGSVYQDLRQRTDEGIVRVEGRLLVGNADTIRATDVGMRFIKSFVAFPSARTPIGSIDQFRTPVMAGSFGSATVPGSSNFVSLRAWELDNYMGTSQVRGGTLGGSIRAHFVAIGY